ncbi:PREDICTED: E3 ubiquitin-protein ligase MARCH11-like, partial [Acanthisitta chloris]|uniref:E3 ubiquitin-protein ligase MARCH11-like n=1 Tax=Acanthisitta chloris TaxID=57068 RepID=UPI0004F0C466
GELLNPCRCDGSVRYTHQLCLLKWISERGSWTCELCCYRYHVIAIKMKKPCQWQSITITLVEKVQMVAVILGSLFLVASVTWLLWSAFSPYAVWQRKDILFQICYGMYGFMDLVCIGLIVHEGASVYRVFKRWRAVNLHWDVLNYDKAMDIEPEALQSVISLFALKLHPLTFWLIVHEGASVYRVFKRWRAVNLHWDVLNYDKAMDIEESNRILSIRKDIVVTTDCI